MSARAPTDAFIARLVEGGVLDDGRVRVRHERGDSRWDRERPQTPTSLRSVNFWVTDLGGPYAFEQTWTEELTRELAAVRALAGDAALDAFVSAGGRVRERPGELEPERARLAAVALEPAHVGALLEAHLRAGGTLYRMNHEGWDEWSFDAAGATFVHASGGEGGSSREVVASPSFAQRYQVADGVIRGYPADLDEARAALAALGFTTFRAFAASR